MQSASKSCALSNQKSAVKYWPQLDGLRAIAFILVFCHHNGMPILFAKDSPVQTCLERAFDWGWLGVDVFFALSAFLVTYLLLSERQRFNQISVGRFLTRRALRIWPLYFSIIAITGFIYPMISGAPAPEAYNTYLQQLIGPLSVFMGNFCLATTGWRAMESYTLQAGLNIAFISTLLLPLWSLCVEEQFYLAISMTLRFCKNISVFAGIACLLVPIGFIARLTLLSGNHAQLPHFTYYMNSLWHLETIMLGVLLSLTVLLKPGVGRYLTSGGIPFVLFSIAIFALAGTLAFSPSIASWRPELALTTSVTSIVCITMLALTLFWKPLIGVLSNKVLMHLGKLSFAMYAFHSCIISNVKPMLHLPDTGLSGILAMAITFLITYAAAVVSWHVLEKHTSRIKTKFSPLHTVAPPDDKGEANSDAVSEDAIHTEFAKVSAPSPERDLELVSSSR